MDINGYMARIERNHANADTLEEIRAGAAADEELTPDEREEVDDRVGTYLAEMERAAGKYGDELGDQDAGA